MFANQRALQPENLKQYAADIGLDAAKFNACFDAAKYQKDIDQDLAEGQTYGVRGTPAFFINGRFLSGAVPFETIQAIIDEELELKGIPKG